MRLISQSNLVYTDVPYDQVELYIAPAFHAGDERCVVYARYCGTSHEAHMGTYDTYAKALKVVQTLRDAYKVHFVEFVFPDDVDMGRS